MKHIFFTIPKPFKDPKISLAQKNAILSWLELTTAENIILFGNDEGVNEFANKYNFIHYPNIKTNKNNIPYLNDAFEKVQKYFDADIYTYINADIILFKKYNDILQNIFNKFSSFLSIGCRHNTSIDFEIDFNKENWDAEFISYAKTHGQITNTTWTDYFTFTKNFWDTIPDFIAGRPIFDIWFLTNALINFKNVIDVTDVNFAIHQNHSYNHVKYNKNEVWFGKDSYFNHLNAGKYYFLGNIKYSYYKYTKDGIIKNWERNGFPDQESFLNFAFFETAADLLVNAKYDKAIEMYEYLEKKNYRQPNFYFSYALSHLNLGNTQKAINYFYNELDLYSENINALTTINQIKDYNNYNISISVIIYGFNNYENITKLIKNIRHNNITSIYLISNNPKTAVENSVIFVEGTQDNLSFNLTKIITNSELNDYVMIINGDNFNITDDFYEKLNKVYQPYNFVQLFYFNTYIKNSNEEIQGFYLNRDYFYEHDKMLYYHLVSNKILFDCFVVNKIIFNFFKFEGDNPEFIHKFWIEFFRHNFVTKLVPYYITTYYNDSYYDLSLNLELNINYNTLENYYYILENVNLNVLFPNLKNVDLKSKAYGDTALFLFNRFIEKKLFKAAISIVTQIAAYTQNIDILNICIPFLVEKFDLKLLRNILTEFRNFLDLTMYQKLMNYIDEHIELSQSIFHESNKFDRVVKLKF